jgi:hypothetical protein
MYVSQFRKLIMLISPQLFLGTDSGVATKALNTIKGYKTLYMKLWQSYPDVLEWTHKTFLYSDFPLVIKPGWLRGIKTKNCDAEVVLELAKALQRAKNPDITNRDAFVKQVRLITQHKRLCIEIQDKCLEINETPEEAEVLINSVNTGDYDTYFGSMEMQVLAEWIISGADLSDLEASSFIVDEASVDVDIEEDVVLETQGPVPSTTTTTATKRKAPNVKGKGKEPAKKKSKTTEAEVPESKGKGTKGKGAKVGRHPILSQTHIDSKALHGRIMAVLHKSKPLQSKTLSPLERFNTIWHDTHGELTNWDPNYLQGVLTWWSKNVKGMSYIVCPLH